MIGGGGERGPTVWVIGAERGPRVALRAELIERGHDAIGFESVRDAVLAGRLPGARRPALAVIDLLGQTAVDVDVDVDGRLLDALFADGSPIIAVAGATEEGDARLRARPWARWLRRPVTIGAIADAAAELIAGRR